MMGAQFIVLAALLAQAPAPVAGGQDKAAAKVLLREGLDLNQRGDYARALEKFHAAYATYPSPKLWFNIGQVERDLGHPAEAMAAFEKFLALVPEALRVLDRGGTVVLAGIHMSEIPPLDYAKHLYLEKTLRSVTAATRRDATELLELAACLPLRSEVETFPLADANEALLRLKRSEIRGAAVLTMG